MGIVNVTPDSFSDGGVNLDVKAAVAAALRMVEDGADLLDIGGESTRPGALPVAEGEERRRVLPVIEALAGRVTVPISIDTYKASVADAALAAGASIVNDISGLRYEPELAGVVARRGAPVILMHTRGRSRDMYEQASYHDVVDEVLDELRESIAFAGGAGVPREQMLVDPGIGFAKDASHSFEVLGRLAEFADLGRPIVVGSSRKSFLNRPIKQASHDARGRVADGGVGGRRGARRRARGPRPRGARDGAGGPRGRRNSEVSSRSVMDWLSQVLRRPPVEWVDLLDIAIVAVLVYELLVLIQGTRAMQIALSGGFLIGFYFLSDWLGLETVNWLIRNLAVYGVFALIVLLQTDIRRALAHFGRAPFFRYFDRSANVDEAVEELVISVSHLAARKIGAMIVIERRIGLRNYIEGGIPLDAAISYDLLASIFQVASPLHDGAVIVQGDRIAAAACFLPLSVNPKMSRELGTRHRAAIGLTEENDAVVIVVSEESGIISLALEGALERGLTPDVLRVKLRALLGLRRRDRPRTTAMETVA